jgi:hypothetical protein
MKDTTKDQRPANQTNTEEINKTEVLKLAMEAKPVCLNNDNLLNLIAEIVVENIVKKLRNGCNRIHQDQ